MEEDRKLVADAQGGDTEAFAQLYDRHVDAIYRYVLLRVPTQEQAEDITEDVFLRAWQNLGQFRPERPILHWLYRIAHNRVVDEHRRKAQHNASLDAMNEAGQQFASSQPDPLRTAISHEEIGNLRTAMSTMKDDEQTLLTLRFIENMSFRDIANILGKSEGACRVLQHRALKKLAQKLQAKELRPQGPRQSPEYST